ncbi:MAG: hypothetical protein A3G41_08190 [Elusimicrobia bacterium RIFCSPLOWO2_12_FULL_59_9]|nr:MAG: hypothetical protein A3G41_08190 [Elusimicrobia bacterium RIFCSPLOWO2_12_FULL_59_9]
MNLYEQQAANKRRTWAIVAVFVVFLAFLGFGFDAFILGMPFPAVEEFLTTGSFRSDPHRDGFSEEEPRRPMGVPVATLAALLGGALMSAASFANGPAMVLKAARARPANPASPAENQFIHVVQEMATAAGLPPPSAHVIPDPDANAFATGTRPSNSAVAVTEGLLQILTREELQGVIAHEVSHIRNYDVRLMTILAALTGAVALLSDWAGRSFRFGRPRRSGASGEGKSGGGAAVLVLLAVWIILLILAPLLSQLLALAVSRRREYLADASGAELTRNPISLALALEKIEKKFEPTASINHGLAHLCIADPKGALMGEKEGFVADLLATHPPILKRIAALREMAYQ